MRDNRNLDEIAQTALRLMKVGRFIDVVKTLQNEHISRDAIFSLKQSLLADALQRTGQNNHAEQIATRYLQISSTTAQVGARCHFVLGNVLRERGNITGAITHFQKSSSITEDDPELACWAQLRLMAAIGEFSDCCHET